MINIFLKVAVSTSHIVALTSELLVFTWGDGRRGQLGHGELETWRSRPEAVESLKTKSITKVGAGDGFSVFASDNGILMTCGDGTLGCLGNLSIFCLPSGTRYYSITDRVNNMNANS